MHSDDDIIILDLMMMMSLSSRVESLEFTVLLVLRREGGPLASLVYRMNREPIRRKGEGLFPLFMLSLETHTLRRTT
jgi:hypothetical protein